MSWRRWLAPGAAVLALGAALLAWLSTRPPSTPNLLLIIVDTIRADRLGTYGYGRDTSPRIDALAAEGVVFERAYGHAPWTAPTVAGIMTGLSPLEHGIMAWDQALPRQHWTLAEHLQGHGYDTMAVVSHVVFRGAMAFQQGFRHYNAKALALGHPEKAVSSVVVTDNAVMQLDKHRTRAPFFQWVHYFDPHFEYIPHDAKLFVPEPHPGPEITAWSDRYDAEIHYTDAQIGRLLDAYRERGLLDDTVVALVGDHGEEFHDHGGVRHSITLFDEVVRVPMIVTAPGLSPGRYGSVVPTSDLAPILLELMGVPAARSWTARSVPFVDGRLQEVPDRDVLMETLRFANKRGLLRWPWKVIDDKAAERVSLYNLERDPAERRDVANRSPKIRDELLDAMEALYAHPRYPAPKRKQTRKEVDELKALGYVE